MSYITKKSRNIRESYLVKKGNKWIHNGSVGKKFKNRREAVDYFYDESAKDLDLWDAFTDLKNDDVLLIGDKDVTSADVNSLNLEMSKIISGEWNKYWYE
jgi:hypothetical protein